MRLFSFARRFFSRVSHARFDRRSPRRRSAWQPGGEALEGRTLLATGATLAPQELLAPSPPPPLPASVLKLSDGFLNAVETATPTSFRVYLGSSNAALGDTLELRLDSNPFVPAKTTVINVAHLADGHVDFVVTTADLGDDGLKTLTARLVDASVPSTSFTSDVLEFTKDVGLPLATDAPAEQSTSRLADGKLNAVEALSSTAIRVEFDVSDAKVGDRLSLLLNAAAFSAPKDHVLGLADITAGYVDFVVTTADLGVDGDKSLTATVTDQAGNVGASSLGLVFLKDVLVPLPPTVPAENGTTAADGWLNATEVATPLSFRIALGGNTFANDTAELLLNGVPFASPKTMNLSPIDIVNGYVDFSVSSTELGADGPKALSARVVDQAGNFGLSAATPIFTKDLVSPTATATPAEQFSTKLSDSKLLVTEAGTSTVIRVNLGTSGAVVGDTLELLLGGVSFAPAKTRLLDALNISDTFVDFVVSTADLGLDGAKAITARVTDAAGNPGAVCPSLEFVKDTTAPAAPGVPAEQGTTKLADSRLNATEAGTSTTFRVSLGTSGAIAGDTLELLLGGASFPTAKTDVLDAADITAGYVDFTVAGADLGADGGKSLSARLTDRNSTGPESTALAFTKDVAAPTAPATPAEQASTKLADGWLNAVEAVTSTTIRVALGTSGAIEGDTVELLLGGASFTTPKSVVLIADDITAGHVDFTVTGADLGAEGAKSLTAIVTDQAGNVGTASIALAFTLDTVAPTVPGAPAEQGTTKLADGILSLVESGTDTTFRVSLGTSGAVAGDTVELLLGGGSFATPKTVVLTAGDITNTYVDFTVAGADLGVDSPKSLTARVIDRAGNVGPAGTALDFIKDTVPPTAPLAPVEQTTTKLADSRLNAAESGTATTIRVGLGTSGAIEGDTVELLLGGASFATPKRVVLTQTNIDDGFVDFTVSGADLGADGAKSLTATVTDVNATSAASNALSFTLDTVAPSAPGVPAEEGSTKLANSLLNGPESATATTFRVALGTSGAAAGDTVELLIGGISFSTPKTIVLTAGDITNTFVEFSVTAAELGADGLKSLSARVTDQAGNVGVAGGSIAFTLNTAAPSAPLTPFERITTKLADGYLNFADSANPTTIRVGGLVAAGAVVGDTLELLLNGSSFPTAKVITLSVAHIADTFADFTVTTADLGLDGGKAITARITNQIGNIGVTSGALSFTKDTGVPTPTGAPAEQGSTKLADGKLNRIESDTSTAIRVALGGSGAVAGDTLELLVSGVSFTPPNRIVLSPADIATGHVDFVVTNASLGADGAKTLSARVIDLAGNAGLVSVDLVFIKDTVDPAPPTGITEQGSTKLANGWLNVDEAATSTTIRIALAAGTIANDTLDLLLNGVPLKTVTINPLHILDGYVDFTVTTAELGVDGAKTLSSRVVDQAGNVGFSTAPPIVFTKDLVLPTATGTPVEQFTSKLSDSILKVTESATAMVIRVGLGTSGAVVDDTLELLIGGVSFPTPKTRLLDALNISDTFVDFVVSTADLGADGAKSITARVTDAAGNPGAVCPSLEFVKDTTAPAAPGAPAEQGTTKLANSTLNAAEAATATTFRVSLGTSGAIEGDTFELLLDGTSFSTPKTDVLDAADITAGYVDFSVLGTDLGADGAKSLSARLTDRNTTGPAGTTLNFTKRVTPPAAPATPAEQATSKLADDRLNAAEAATSTTIRVGGLVAAGAVAGDTVELLSGGASFATPKSRVLTATDQANGYVDFTVSATDLGADGAKSLTAFVTDLAGNAGAVSGTLAFMMDTVVPTAPGAPAEQGTNKLADGILNLAESATSTTLRVSIGTSGAGEGDTVELLLGGSSFATAKTVQLTLASLADGYVEFVVATADLGADGAKQLSARVTDLAGNAGPAGAGLSFTKATMPPAAPVLSLGTGVANGATQAEATQASGVVTVSGAAGNAIVVTLTRGGSTVTRNLTGTGSPQIVTLLAADLTTLGNGPIDVASTQTDAAGNTGTAATASFTLDTIAPTAPNAPAEQGSSKLANNFLNAAESATTTTFRVGLGGSGAVAGDAVELLIGGSSFSTPKVVTLAAGDITNRHVDFSVSSADLGADGSKSLTARVTDQAGNAGVAGSALAFTKDTTAPPAPTLALGTGVANGATQSEATQASGVVTVTGEAGAAIVVTFSRGAATVSKSLTGTGSAQAVVLMAADLTTLGDGLISVTALQADTAGNLQTAATTTTSFTLDTTPPPAPTLALGLGVANGATQSEATQGSGAVTVTGESGAAIVVTFSRGAASVTKNLTGTGSSQAVTLLAADLITLGNGTVNVSATQTDAAGNPQTAPAATTSFTLDTVAPVAPTLALGTGVAGGATAAKATQASGVVTIAGESGAAIVVTFSRGAATVTKTLTGTGSAQPVTLLAAELITLGDGVVNVSALQTDAAGNPQTVAAATTSFTLDTVAPVAPTLVLGPGVTEPVSSATAEAGAVTVAGEIGSAIAVTFTRGASTVTKNLVGTGAAQPVTLSPADVASLGDGSVAVSATQSDAAGNPQTNPPATLSFTLDSTAPAAPTLLILSGVASGATAAEATQSGGIVSVVGDVGFTIVVTFTRGANTVTRSFLATGVGQPVTLSSADLTTLGNGLVSVSATQTDAAGNTSPAATTSFTLDTVNPSAPVITGVVDDVASFVGTVAKDGVTNDNELRIVGTAEPGATVAVRNGSALLGSAVADGSGNWAFTSPRLADGDHSLTAFATDVAGNANPSSRPGYGFTVDTSTPDAAVITTVTDNVGSITGNVPNGSRTDDTTFRIAGTAEPGSLVTVRSGNAVLRRVFASETGNWAVVTDPLAVRLHNLNAFARDAAGNNGPASANRTITIDQTAPTILSLGSTTSAGSYGQAAEIRLFARTSERMRAGSAIDVTLNTGAVVRLSTTSERSELNGTYRIAPGVLASPLTIVSVANVSPIASDIAGNPVAGLPSVPVVLSGISVDAAILAAAIGFATDPALAPAIAAPVTSIPIVFTTDVTGVSLDDFQLFYNDRKSVSLRGSTITGSGRNYTLTIPASLTNRVGSYRLTIGPSTGIQAVDGGAPLTVSSTVYWTRV